MRGLCWEGGEGRAGVTTGVTTGVTRWLQLCCLDRVNWGWWWEIHSLGAAGLELHPKGRLGSGFAKIFLWGPKPVEKSKPRGFWRSWGCAGAQSLGAFPASPLG